MKLAINGETRQVEVPSDMPVLWVLRDVLGMTGTKFGCGMALCGACTVQLEGQAIRSCVTPVSAVAGKAITTIEAIGDTPAGKRVQEAWSLLSSLKKTSLRFSAIAALSSEVLRSGRGLSVVVHRVAATSF